VVVKEGGREDRVPIELPRTNTSDKTSLNIEQDTTPNPVQSVENLTARDLRVPGGFRRFFLMHQSPTSTGKTGTQASHQTAGGKSNGSASENAAQVDPNVDVETGLGRVIPTRSFFDFLGIYGNFAGSCLWNEEEIDEMRARGLLHGDPLANLLKDRSHGPIEEEVTLDVEARNLNAPSPTANVPRPLSAGSKSLSGTHTPDSTNEESALLSKKVLPPYSAFGNQRGELESPGMQPPSVQGTASPFKAFLLLIKSFIGTGVLYLPSVRHTMRSFFPTGCIHL
jgi:hypothetical protein